MTERDGAGEKHRSREAGRNGVLLVLHGGLTTSCSWSIKINPGPEPAHNQENFHLHFHIEVAKIFTAACVLFMTVIILITSKSSDLLGNHLFHACLCISCSPL